MGKPKWFDQLTWSPAQQVQSLNVDLAPPGAGLYLFTKDKEPVTAKNALYIGKSDGARQTLRNRLGVYARRFKDYPGGRKSRHAAMELLAAYNRAHPERCFVRWAGVVVARELEGRLIELFDPDFNNKDEHRCGFSDDELLPDELLYVWP
jgi:hypothetical protein